MVGVAKLTASRIAIKNFNNNSDMVPDVELTKVEFISKRDLGILEKKIIELLKDFEKEHKQVPVYAETIIRK